jgi:hypothetical protein
MAAADAESSIGSQVALLEARLAEQTAALDGARKEAADAQASLRSMESEVHHCLCSKFSHENKAFLHSLSEIKAFYHLPE